MLHLKGSKTLASVFSDDSVSVLEKSCVSSVENGALTMSTKSSEQKDAEEVDTVKTKLAAMWNNVRYSWNFKTKTHFAKDSPIWLLGRIYHQSHRPENNSGSTVNNDFEALKNDFATRIYLSYRKEFPVLDGTYLTSDCGWGCMLRSGQMLLAQALVFHFLGRDWRWTEVGKNREEFILEESLHRAIIQWFGDNPSPSCPLSIHQMVQQGQMSGKQAGDWYGPVSVSYILKEILQQASSTHPELDTLRMYIAQDCTVYLEDVRKHCCSQPNYKGADMHDQWKSLILLIPLRLGGEHLNLTYESCLKGFLSLEQCIGIIGGRPRHSLYFVGWQDEYLIHLDPHHCQDMVDVLTRHFPLKSFHCKEMCKTSLKRMDPSCCVGFYLRTRQDFEDFRANVQHYLVPPQTEYPIFTFSNGNNPHVDSAWLQWNATDTSTANRSDDSLLSEGFEFL